MSHDVIAARLRCPSCGAANPGDEVRMQVWWTANPENRTLRAGDSTGGLPDPEAAGYLPLGDRAPGEPLRILDTWECGACGRPYQWAVTTVDDQDRIVSVEAVELGAEALRTAHFVSDLLRFIYPEITGEPMTDERGRYETEWKERLLAAFAAGRRWPPS
jgi:hypothetical protein